MPMTRTIVYDWMLLRVCVLDGHGDIVKQLNRSQSAKVEVLISLACGYQSYAAIEMVGKACSLDIPSISQTQRSICTAVRLSTLLPQPPMPSTKGPREGDYPRDHLCEKITLSQRNIGRPRTRDLHLAPIVFTFWSSIDP